MNLAIIGATGLVGEEMLKVLDQRKIQFTNLTLVSSKKSVGKSLNFQEKSYQLISIEDALEKELDVAIMAGYFLLMVKFLKRLEKTQIQNLQQN